MLRLALRNIFRETKRLLAPGGVMAHSDGVRSGDLFSKYYSEWMAHFNNEPFLDHRTFDNYGVKANARLPENFVEAQCFTSAN